MEYFYSWVRTIIFYMIFINFVTNLLPGKAYIRYIRLFMGMILILLVLRPLTGSLRLDEQLARCFEEISFQNEAGEFKGQLDQIEQQRFETMIDEYEKAASFQAEEQLEKRGYRDLKIRVSIDRERDSPSFGAVKEVEVSAGQKKEWEMDSETAPDSGENQRRTEQTEYSEQEIRQVSTQKNHIQIDLGDRMEPDAGEAEEKTLVDSGTEKSIRKEIADFYGLEEGNIKIKFRD